MHFFTFIFMTSRRHPSCLHHNWLMTWRASQLSSVGQRIFCSLFAHTKDTRVQVEWKCTPATERQLVQQVTPVQSVHCSFTLILRHFSRRFPAPSESNSLFSFITDDKKSITWLFNDCTEKERETLYNATVIMDNLSNFFVCYNNYYSILTPVNTRWLQMIEGLEVIQTVIIERKRDDYLSRWLIEQQSRWRMKREPKQTEPREKRKSSRWINCWAHCHSASSVLIR